jgi:hypothetical protein
LDGISNLAHRFDAMCKTDAQEEYVVQLKTKSKSGKEANDQYNIKASTKSDGSNMRAILRRILHITITLNVLDTTSRPKARNGCINKEGAKGLIAQGNNSLSLHEHLSKLK